MRHPDRTDSNGLSQQTPTLDVMDLINSESRQPWTWDSDSILRTVTVSSVTSPVEPVAPNWVQCPNTPEPKLIIVEQPKQRGMRFRYKCEGRSAGSILGESSTENTKTLPAIALLNCEEIHSVEVKVCLVWKDPPYRIHPHGLVGKDCQDGICEITLHPDEGQTQHSFSNLGIQCVRKKEIETSVNKKLNLGIDPYSAGMWRHHEEVDLNVVRLCFQAWYTTPSGQRMCIGPVLSESVYDKKSTNTSELKICRMNKDHGRCDGGEELYILCDKVQKEDIKVMFLEGEWQACADFSQADVHRQIAIVLKTPPYHDLHIKDPTPVQVCLQRIGDGIRSEGVIFTYMPRAINAYGLGKKRQRLSSPFDDINGPDPHGIESKRNQQVRHDYTDHCNATADLFPNHEPFPNLDYFSVNLMGTNEPTLHEPFLEDSTTNLNAMMPWIHGEYNELADPVDFENFAHGQVDNATASLVGDSLALTGEHGQHFANVAYLEDPMDRC
ncbi:transcription factor RelB isoform X2 [Dendrobates tinctorius]|uniref:transcription factor RelB isoform X2 n=1 Tax=Dendrobates tinctorius TaxID=92724 RepID=UPI003CC9F859